jgi:hypothetical protein
MPATSKNSAQGKSKIATAKSEENKSSNGKKQGTVNIKATSAREKARGFDEGRRSDANSNEM